MILHSFQPIVLCINIYNWANHKTDYDVNPHHSPQELKVSSYSRAILVKKSFLYLVLSEKVCPRQESSYLFRVFLQALFNLSSFWSSNVVTNVRLSSAVFYSFFKPFIKFLCIKYIPLLHLIEVFNHTHLRFSEFNIKLFFRIISPLFTPFYATATRHDVLERNIPKRLLFLDQIFSNFDLFFIKRIKLDILQHIMILLFFFIIILINSMRFCLK